MSTRLRIAFFGSPDFAVPSLEALAPHHDIVAVVTQPDRPAGRGKQLAPPAVKARALRLGLRVEQPTTLKDGALTRTLTELSPDLFVVVAYGRILPVPLLDVPRLGPWNVHASLLPRFRGAAPIQWSIIRGEATTGVCVMRMEAGLDTGPVVACVEETIRDDDTAGTLSARLAPLGAQLMRDTLPTIAQGTATPRVQDHAAATLAPILKKEDGRLDFRQSARELSCRARGVDPWPGATAALDGEVIKLFGPRIVEHTSGSPDRSGHPGEVLGLDPAGLIVACGQGAIAFAELQLPGRRRLPAAAVLAGRPIPRGTRLDGEVIVGA